MNDMAEQAERADSIMRFLGCVVILAIVIWASTQQWGEAVNDAKVWQTAMTRNAGTIAVVGDSVKMEVRLPKQLNRYTLAATYGSITVKGTGVIFWTRDPRWLNRTYLEGTNEVKVVGSGGVWLVNEGGTVEAWR